MIEFEVGKVYACSTDHRRFDDRLVLSADQQEIEYQTIDWRGRLNARIHLCLRSTMLRWWNRRPPSDQPDKDREPVDG